MNSHKQKGALLLALSVALVTTAATVVAMTVASRPAKLDIPAEMQDLQNVKSALLAYAASYTDSTGPGRLPCPADLKGQGEGACNGNKPGYLPAKNADGRWQLSSLGTKHSDFHYAVDKFFRENSKKDLNSTAKAGLRVDQEENVVAVLMLSGKAVEAGSEFSNPDNFADNMFSRGANKNTNARDFVVSIHHDELMTVATASVAAAIRTGLDTFYTSKGTFPSDSEFTSALGTMPTWFVSDKWDSVVTYRFNDKDSFSVKFNDCNITFTSSVNTPTLARDRRSCASL